MTTPTDSLTIKLMSLAVHTEEFISEGGHQYDLVAIEALLADPEITVAREAMDKLALLPVKREDA